MAAHVQRHRGAGKGLQHPETAKWGGDVWKALLSCLFSDLLCTVQKGYLPSSSKKRYLWGSKCSNTSLGFGPATSTPMRLWRCLDPGEPDPGEPTARPWGTRPWWTNSQTLVNRPWLTRPWWTDPGEQTLVNQTLVNRPWWTNSQTLVNQTLVNGPWWTNSQTLVNGPWWTNSQTLVNRPWWTDPGETAARAWCSSFQ